MRTVSRQWIRRLRRGVRERCSGRPREWRRAARLRRRARAGRVGGVIVGGGAVLAIALGLARALHDPGYSDGLRLFAWSYLLLLAVTAVVFFLDHRLGSDSDLVFHALHPADPRWVARRQMRRAGLDSLWLWGLATATFAWVGSRDAGPWLALAAAAGLAAGAAVTALGTGLWLVGRAGRWTYLGMVALWLALGVVLIPLQWVPWARDQLVEILNRHGETLAVLIPTSWIVRPWRAALAGGPATEALWLLPVVVLAASVPSRWRAVVASYRFRDAILLRYAAQLPDDIDPEIALEFDQALRPPESRDRAEIIAGLREAGLPPGRLEFGGDWMERRIWAWWTPRERRIATWALADWPSLGRRTVRGAACLAVTFLLGWGILVGTGRAAGDLGPPVLAWVLGGAISALFLLPFGSGLGGALATDPDRTVAFLRMPVALRELQRVSWKIAVVRAAVALPCLMAFAGAIAAVAGSGGWVAMGIVVRGVLACLLLRPLFLVAGLANGLASPPGLAGLAAFAAVVGGVIVGVGSAILAAVVPAWGWAILPLVAAVAAGGATAYAALFDRRRMDARKSG